MTGISKPPTTYHKKKKIYFIFKYIYNLLEISFVETIFLLEGDLKKKFLLK